MITFAALVGLLHAGPLLGLSAGWSEKYYAGLTVGAQVATARGFRIGGFAEAGLGGKSGSKSSSSAYEYDENVERCRESATGKFTKTSNCDDSNTDLYFVGGFNSEVLYPVMLPYSKNLLGLGLRLGQGVKPYGVFQSSDLQEIPAQWCVRAGYRYIAIEARVQSRIF